MRVKMIVAYDGTNYCGWQIQPNGVTIEQKLNEALSALLGEEIKVTGASRTDAGVHSFGNVCIFDTNTRMPAEKISYAVNQRLPEDIVVQDSCEVDEEFHPRFSKSRKTYEYRILNRRFRMPTRRLDTYFYHHPLDDKKMQQAAQYFVGKHDFLALCASGSSAAAHGDTVRTITACYVQRRGDDIDITVTADGYLYNMVRILAGTLCEAGAGRLAPEAVPGILASRDRKNAGPTLAAKGLFLKSVDYDTPIE